MCLTIFQNSRLLIKMLKVFVILIVAILLNVACDETDAVQKPIYKAPDVSKGSYNFLDTFDDADAIGIKWIKSLASKPDVDDEQISKYDGEWSIESAIESALDGDKGLVLKTKAKHHAISARLDRPFDFASQKPLIVQYEVKFQTSLECGGAYIKLLSSDVNLSLEQFFDKTPYTIMFGPDKCGNENKLHFILRHKHPLTHVFEEKHAKKTEHIEPFFNDGRTHLYTLILYPNNQYKIMIDQNDVNTGSLLSDMQPPITPEKEIVDPNDQKPETWDEREKITDPDATKPDDWDEEQPREILDTNAKKPNSWLDDELPTLPDPNAVKPDDWDDDTDGEWEAPKIDNPKCINGECGQWSAPMIRNPNYKGKWVAPLVDNPNYQGKWEPKKIANPDYFEDNDPFKSIIPISAIGLELWSMNDNIYFDNFLITDNEQTATEFAKDTWLLKKNVEFKPVSTSQSVFDALIKPTSDKPWLWAVYLLVVLIPIILVVLFCCGNSNKAVTAQKKKTDEVTEDDKEDVEPTLEPQQEQKESDENVENGNSEDESKANNDEKTDKTKSPRQRRSRKE